MDKKQAMQILRNEQEVQGHIWEKTIIVSPEDIKTNLDCNDFELDLDWIQDLTSVDEDGNYEMFQGHSLGEVEIYS